MCCSDLDLPGDRQLVTEGRGYILYDDNDNNDDDNDNWLSASRCMDRYSSVDIATRYRLDGPEIESQWGRDFLHPSTPALGPTHPPIQYVPTLSRR